MNLTPGEILFYGSIAGLAIVVIAAIITIALLSRRRKRLDKEFNKEYGGKEDGEGKI